MDERLSTGDEDFKDRANERLRSIIDATKMLILASHSRDLLLATCNRIICLEHGRVSMRQRSPRCTLGVKAPPERFSRRPGHETSRSMEMVLR
jgi:ABC-type polysaccharide/polyol phosphate transport system ATPase subunit